MVRCFVGVMLPQEIIVKVRLVQQQVAQLPIECRLVEEHNLHICLSFLGDVEESKIAFYFQLLDKICGGYGSFKVNVAGVKLIPTERYVRVIVLNIVDSEIFDKLRKEVVEKIGGDSKPLHVTLCRVRNVLDKQRFLAAVEKIKSTQVGTFVVEDVQLIKSELRPTGPVYSVIHESRLKK